MAKKPAKPAAKASTKTAAKTPAKAKAAAKAAAKPVKAETKPDETQVAAAKPKPAVAPKPVPPHQQFLSKGVHGGLKPQHMSKGRIFRHQGR